MKYLVASPIAHVAALTCCICTLLYAVAEAVREAFDLTLRVLLDFSWGVQSLQLAAWYACCIVLSWAMIEMTVNLDGDEDDATEGWLEIGPIELVTTS